MTPPPHILNLYRKPRQASGQVLQYIDRFPVRNYKHTISANGWFDTATCDVRFRSATDAETFFENYLGNRVSVIVDNPIAPIWEGYINRISYTLGGVTMTTSLDEMANSALAIISSSNSALPSTTAVANNTTSQAIYGIKQGGAEAGFQWGGTGVRAVALRDALLASRSYPQSSITAGGGGAVVSLEMLGFYQTLKWQQYSSVSAVAITFRNFVLTLLGLSFNTVFFDPTDTTLIATNGALRDTGDSPGRNLWECFDNLAMCGDNTGVPWVIGITPTDFITGTRRLYYRESNSAVEYSARASENLRIRNLYGKKVEPWLIVPDRSVQIIDVLTGYTPPGDDPRVMYINSVAYDAEAQQTQVYGYDDISNDAAVGSRTNRPLWFGVPLKARYRVT